MKVLVIDNEQFLAETLSKYLETSGIAEIQFATSLHEAMNLLKMKSYDLIITDLSLPDAAGNEWLLDLELLNPGQKLIILSAYHLPKSLCLSDKLNIIGYFEKPFDAKIIVNLINQLTN